MRAACDVWNDRVDAVSNGVGEVQVEALRLRTYGVEGEGVDMIRKAAGDLFDPGELFTAFGARLMNDAIADVLKTGDVQSALATVIIQATAVGVLTERLRWERGE